jgi:hypothetical protein
MIEANQITLCDFIVCGVTFPFFNLLNIVSVFMLYVDEPYGLRPINNTVEYN